MDGKKWRQMVRKQRWAETKIEREEKKLQRLREANNSQERWLNPQKMSKIECRSETQRNGFIFLGIVHNVKFESPPAGLSF